MEPDLLKDLDLTDAEEAFLRDAHTWSLANINQSRVTSEVYLIKVLREMIHKLIKSNEKIEKERKTLERALIVVSVLSVFVASYALILSSRSVDLISGQLDLTRTQISDTQKYQADQLELARTQISDTQQFHRLSLKPAVYFENIYVPSPPKPQFGLHLTNNGTGMAILETMTVFVDDQPVQLKDRYFAEVAEKLGLLEQDLPIQYVSSMVEYCPPGEEPLLLLGMDNKYYTPEVGTILAKALGRITRMEFTFKSRWWLHVN